MILATGVAVLWRRGWRQAAFHTVPLGIIYAAWYVGEGASISNARTAGGQRLPSLDLNSLTHFMWTAALGLFAGLGHFPLVGWVLATTLVVGVVLAWIDAPDGHTRAHRLGMPIGLMLGAAVGMAAAAP